MSKKQKIKKKIVIPERTSEKRIVPTSATAKSPVVSGANLILFDKKSRVFLLILLLSYLLLSLLKIHTSNIANWDLYFGMEKSESVIAGTPRFIRMDEWMINTPAIIGQYEAGMPIKNEANGGGNAPVAFGLPIKDISSILRPVVWPFFILDVETAYAFYWNFNIFFFLISMFLLFMLLTKNNFWISLFGAFFIFLAPAEQWWSYGIGMFMMYLNGMTISFIYLLYARNTLSLIISTLVLVISIFSFLSFLYPPFQIPLVYLYLAILVGYLWKEKNFKLIKNNLPRKIVIAGAGLIILGFILFHYYQIAKDTFAMMVNTVYPGKRVSVGGDLRDGKIFADFFGMFMSDQHHPRLWENICEASGAFMVFPIVFYTIGHYYFKTRRSDNLLLALSAYVIIGLIYVLVGFPVFLSNITLFSMSPAFRALPIIAIGNCVLLVCFLASKHLEYKGEKISKTEFWILAAAIFIFIIFVTSYTNKVTEKFFTSVQVVTVLLIVLATYLLTRYKNLKYAKPALCVILILAHIKNFAVNPVTKGLSPVVDNPLTSLSRSIHDQDPGAKWALFGNARLTHLIKASGNNILNGVKYVPPLEEMRKLDIYRQYDTIYNRFAWISMSMYIDGKDSLYFRKTFNDSYTIHMDPCSPRLKNVGVKYIVFDYEPKNVETRCMTKVGEVQGIHVYKRNDQ